MNMYDEFNKIDGGENSNTVKSFIEKMDKTKMDFSNYKDLHKELMITKTIIDAQMENDYSEFEHHKEMHDSEVSKDSIQASITDEMMPTVLYKHMLEAYRYMKRLLSWSLFLNSMMTKSSEKSHVLLENVNSLEIERDALTRFNEIQKQNNDFMKDTITNMLQNFGEKQLLIHDKILKLQSDVLSSILKSNGDILEKISEESTRRDRYMMDHISSMSENIQRSLEDHSMQIESIKINDEIKSSRRNDVMSDLDQDIPMKKIEVSKPIVGKLEDDDIGYKSKVTQEDVAKAIEGAYEIPDSDVKDGDVKSEVPTRIKDHKKYAYMNYPREAFLNIVKRVNNCNEDLANLILEKCTDLYDTPYDGMRAVEDEPYVGKIVQNLWSPKNHVDGKFRALELNVIVLTAYYSKTMPYEDKLKIYEYIEKNMKKLLPEQDGYPYVIEPLNIGNALVNKMEHDKIIDTYNRMMKKSCGNVELRL